MIRKTIHYSGDVQGVGFRYTAHRTAVSFKVTGYVRNLPDGRVELVAEGEPAEVQRFINAVADNMAGNIDDIQETDAAAQGQFASFEIRR